LALKILDVLQPLKHFGEYNMKTLILALALTLSTGAFASATVEANKTESALQILDLVVGVKTTYSETSKLEAKVVELLAGDGVNALNLALVLSSGRGETPRVFSLSPMTSGATRITFLAKDLIVINYTQDSFKGEDATPIVVKESLTIKVLRNADGSLAGKIEILE
jgi:hypothetical protein